MHAFFNDLGGKSPRGMSHQDAVYPQDAEAASGACTEKLSVISREKLVHRPQAVKKLLT